MLQKLLIVLISGALMIGCKNEKNAPEDAAAAPLNAAPENSVHLSAEEINNAGIKTGKPEIKQMQQVMRTNGILEVPPQNVVSVSIPLGGYVRSINLIPGTPVKKGTVLARVEDQQFIQLQQDYLVAKSRLQFLQADYTRQKGLNETSAISEKVFQQVRSDYESQRVLVNALQEKLRLIGINPAALNADNISRSVAVLSPINGYVSKVNVNAGKYAAPTDILFELINPADLHLSLTVFEKDIAGIAVGQKVVCYTNTNPEKKYEATVMLVNRSVDQNRASEVHCHIEGIDRSLLPGMYMNAEIALNQARANVVPDDAVVRWQNKHYIFVAEPDNRFLMVPAEPGVSQNGFTAISNLVSGKEVVTGNAYALLMKLKNSSEEE